MLNKTVKFISMVLAFCLLMTAGITCCAEGVIDIKKGSDLLYTNYKKQYENENHPDETITVLSNETILSSDGNCLLQKDIEVQQPGMYAFEINYMVSEELSEQPALRIKLDGQLPYYEAMKIELPQLFMDKTPLKPYDTDIPTCDVLPEYQTRYLYDTVGCYGGLLEFHLNAGKNTVSVELITGDINISQISFKKYNSPSSYSKAKNFSNFKKYNGDSVIIEAETVSKKSNSTIFAVNDRSSANVSPSSVYKKYINALGGTNWEKLGQFVEWEFTVPNDGLYSICIKYRKETNSGLNSNRRIYIDGEIPYSELENYTFGYTDEFANEVLNCNGEKILFPLKKGNHTIKMEVSIGKYSQILPDIYAATEELQSCYRQFIMVMGTAPDSLRNYELDKSIPDVLLDMKQQRIILEKKLKELEKISGGSSSGTKLMVALIDQIKHFEKDSYYIAGDIQAFKSNIASVITWTIDVKLQPLKIDYISLCAPDSSPAPAKPTMFASFAFSLKSFLYTFSSKYEYATLSSKDSKTLTVWDPSGATEFNIWHKMIENDFSAKHPDINIEFRNISTPFQSAFLSGLLPDVYVGVTLQSLMEFAFRKCIVTDLSRFSDFNDTLKNYNITTYKSTQWNGKTYGFPIGISVPAVFYRTDILNELKLKVPETWDDLIYVSSMLQKKNLQVGIGPTINHWTNMIYQDGGKRVDEDRKTTYLTSNEAIETFNKFTSFFTEYSSPVAFSAFDRFRTGEMPIVLGDVSFINQLEVLAPEISGKWDFTHYPATQRANGNIDYTITGGSPTYMIITDKNPNLSEEAWEFIKWRGSADTCVSVNRQMEMSIGRSVRAVSGNREAQHRISWSKKVQQLYDFYEDKRYAEPQIPGNYFIERAFKNAWTAVYYQDAVPGDALKLYIPAANAEILRRREYFGMDNTTGMGN